LIFAMVRNFGQQNLSLETMTFIFHIHLSLIFSSILLLIANQRRVDDVKLDSYQGLGMIPREILDQGSKVTINYLLDLFRSPEGEALFRSKIMAVGYESVGKTALLHSLFPMKGTLFEYEGLLGMFERSYFFVLKGQYLTKFKDEEAYASTWQFPAFIEQTELSNREWNVTENNTKSEKGRYGITLSSVQPSRQKRVFSIFAESQEEREQWMVRLKRVCRNEATHGISIANPDMNDHPIVVKEMARRKEKTGEEGKLELSVWDFAGQHDYYNIHHYFLSTRTVFLVLYRLDQGAKGLEGLSFWIRSLSGYLDPSTCHKEFSVVVVGTFLDLMDGRKKVKKQERANQVNKIFAEQAAKMNKIFLGFHYFEVSCSTQENINDVEEAIYYSLFNHSYMGERVPKAYLIVERAVKQLRLSHQLFPMVEIQEISQDQGVSTSLIKRALSFLSLWGECVYFEEPEELAEIVILDPEFLTQGILADLFRHEPNIQSQRKDGIIQHSSLSFIWSRFKDNHKGKLESLLVSFVSLLQKLGVLFVMEEDQEKPFLQQRSILPFLLPTKPIGKELARFEKIWPKDAPYSRPIEVERILKFNVLPGELVSRLLVLLHPYIQEGLVWKNEVVIFNKMHNTQGWIRAELDLNRFIITLRGSDLSKCKELLQVIVGKVEEVGKKHKGIEWRENFRSPYFHECEIEEKEVLADYDREEEKKGLVCPVTGFPINAEKLLERAGLIEGEKEKTRQGLNFIF